MRSILAPRVDGPREPLEYLFGPFRIDERERVLTRDGAIVALTPKVFDTLLYLVQHAGATVSREELQTAVWPDAVVTDANLTQNVWVLRRALDDQGNPPRYLATSPRRGYRFVANVVAQPLEKRPHAPSLALTYSNDGFAQNSHWGTV